MDINIKELDAWFDQHKDDIPKRPAWKRTLLDIMGCTKLENRWSDIYQFFLLEKEEHGLKDLFIRSLEEILGLEKGWMRNFCVLREDSTKETNINTEPEFVEVTERNDSIKENGRIDLLILGEDQKAIIIENKVFHTLDNPLEQYVKTTKMKGWTNIKVVVLSLYDNYDDVTMVDGCDCFNVTHCNYINRVLANLPIYISNANLSYKPLLEDFIQNILNVTNMSATDDELLFFYKEFENLSKIQELYSRIIGEYKSALKKINFDGLKTSYKSIKDDDKNQLVFLQYQRCPRLFLTVMLNYLWNKGEHKVPFVRIVLELHPAAVSDNVLKEIKQEIENINGKNPHVYYSILEEKEKKWRHLAFTDIDIQPQNNELFIRPEKLAKTIKNINLVDSSIYKLGLKVIELIKDDTPNLQD